MAIIKNEIPILEFDTEQTAVLNPWFELTQEMCVRISWCLHR